MVQENRHTCSQQLKLEKEILQVCDIPILLRNFDKNNNVVYINLLTPSSTVIHRNGMVVHTGYS